MFFIIVFLYSFNYSIYVSRTSGFYYVRFFLLTYFEIFYLLLSESKSYPVFPSLFLYYIIDG